MFQRSPIKVAQVIAINISRGGIPKLPIQFVHINGDGLKGDGHQHEKHNNPLQAVCLWDLELLEDLQQEGFPLTCGTIGENLTVCHLNIQKLMPGTILEFSTGVVLELTRERKPCYVLDSIDIRLKEVIVGRCGYYAKVLRAGILEVGETISIRSSY